MTAFAIVVALAVGAFIVVNLLRVAAGPTVFDRALAAAALAANGVVLLIVIAFLFGRIALFVDIAIAYGLLNAVWPIALAKYFEGQRDRGEEYHA